MIEFCKLRLISFFRITDSIKVSCLEFQYKIMHSIFNNVIHLYYLELNDCGIVKSLLSLVPPTHPTEIIYTGQIQFYLIMVAFSLHDGGNLRVCIFDMSGKFMNSSSFGTATMNI